MSQTPEQIIREIESETSNIRNSFNKLLKEKRFTFEQRQAAIKAEDSIRF